MVDTNDPSTWPHASATGFVLGLDLGFAQDHSALVVAGVWPGAGHAIGIVHIEQIPLGIPMNEVADMAAALARQHRAKTVVDLSNNSAFATLLAARLPSPQANYLVAGVITGADTHAATPQAMPVSIGAMRGAIPRWMLSKAQLVEDIGAEIDNGTLRMGQVGDWEKLRDELHGMERMARRSGTVCYSAGSGKHDDLVLALSLAVFGCRRVLAPPRIRRVRQGPVSWAAWS
jgi:hypothetical protein